MGRKSKQAGTGHLPLTNHEIKTYSKEDAYGTTTARLSRASQLNFGDCSLSLHPAVDAPVCTPSGHIYERQAILTYLLTKTKELKNQEQEHEEWNTQKEKEKARIEDKKRAAHLQSFVASNSAVQDTNILSKKKKAKLDNNTDNSLKVTSYWLADSQPRTPNALGGGDGSDGTNDLGTETRLVVHESSSSSLPPKRPPSPHSGQPLRRKDLINLQLNRNSDDQVICAVSEKSITSQPAVALVTTKSSKKAETGDDKNTAAAAVILKSVYDDLSIKQEKICPVTGRKVVKVVKLRQGGSSFATDDGREIQATQYRPTMT